MIRRLSGIAWRTGKFVAMVTGLTAMLALTIGYASVALAGNGVGAPFNLGTNNTVNRISTLTGTATTTMLRVVNNGTGPALNLKVRSGVAPMTVNSTGKVTNLNVDQLDGQDSSGFIKNDVYKSESDLTAGTQKSDGTFVNSASCFPGDVLLSGGPANLSSTTDLIESFPTPGSITSWSARVDKNGQQDIFNVVVLCADQ